MARKNLLADLLGEGVAAPDNGELTAVNSVSSSDSTAGPERGHPLPNARGAVGAMSKSLERFAAGMDQARLVEERLKAGLTVVELDPAMIDSSFVSDRVAGSESDQGTLIQSIREHGQQVPILVRPHPELKGRYQVAYGHRRLRAATSLGRLVRAVVRDLTDDQLVVAQGQENSERRDLSFIERASFAATLEDRGFGRETIMAALSVDKTELSRLIAVSRTIPRRIVDTIGPAPNAGRRRWMELGARLQHRGAEKIIDEILTAVGFSEAESGDRFMRLFTALETRKKKAVKPTIWTDNQGRQIARIEQGRGRVSLSIDETVAPDFGAYLLSQLPEIYEAFRRRVDA